MGLTVSRKTAKNLAVRRKNERILTVSRKKMLTVKKSNHKIRYRDLLLSLMCYAFTCSGSENYNRNRKCRKCLHNLSHGCRCASWQTFWQLYYFTTFYFLSCWLVAMAVLKAIVSLCRTGEGKPIGRYKTRVKVAEENKLFSSFQKKIIIVWCPFNMPQTSALYRRNRWSE